MGPSSTTRQGLPQLLGCFRSTLCPSRVTPRILLVYCLLCLAVTTLLGIRMHFKGYLSAALYGLPILSQAAVAATTDPFKAYTISAENITATLIPYGARLTSLKVPDRDGNFQDVVVGYDDPKRYLQDTETNRTFFGAVVGRYANRIKNGTFTIGTEEYHIPENENGGEDTLHGGPLGYDGRNWTVTAYSNSSITFTLVDRAFENFPGDVITHATFSVQTEATTENPKGLPQLTTKLVALALTETTPIMLANHIYWNLNAFKNETILEDTWLQLPLSRRLIGTDGILIPDGSILDVSTAYNGSADFTAGKLVGQDIEEAYHLCGSNCTGYDNCFIVDRPPQYAAASSVVPIVRLNSSTTGISLEVATNQQALQIYSCNGQNGTIPIKDSQIKTNEAEGISGAEYVNKYGCLVIETEGWIDGINNPQWGQLPDQIYSPETGPSVNYATYRFGTV
ncbi:aldose epimerase family protein [Aspergillus saccharolyticus JOP 1030-1]|uniref:Galactose mutarotase-like protein n=1 Tax=Aspergillus saccharolyticus JOP 1030-1 TaxID=1450539 RepID=A0A318Z5X6_9EURO|nr:galactose mutarotase-like protein [Aspergillus saccharolyticus JOP 1030-1]PYH40143.1 galactose mutarotase-like protein [Aspergillus saccharolyticus JOP 1030-1]